MSENRFVSDNESSESDSEGSFEALEEEPEGENPASGGPSGYEAQENAVGPYSDEPIADAEWLEEYNKQMEDAEVVLQEYTKRLNGETSTDSWCTCGNCKTENLQNPCECQCCQEIDGCITSLNSDLVLAEVESPPPCITLHPGFVQVCLQTWSLRLAAGKYRTMAKKSYRLIENEERYFRAIAYREFSQLVHGYLGKRRLPLPACAYEAIRTAFPGESHTGYIDETEI